MVPRLLEQYTCREGHVAMFRTLARSRESHCFDPLLQLIRIEAAGLLFLQDPIEIELIGAALRV